MTTHEELQRRARQCARRTLDLAREGQPVPSWAVIQALIETGDIDLGDVPMYRVRRMPGSWERGDHGLLRPATWVDVLL